MCFQTSCSWVCVRFKAFTSIKYRRFASPSPRNAIYRSPKHECVFQPTVKYCKESLASNHWCHMFQATKYTVSSQPTTITANNTKVSKSTSNLDTTQKEQMRSNDCQSGQRPTVYLLQSPSYFYTGMFLHSK